MTQIIDEHVRVVVDHRQNDHKRLSAIRQLASLTSEPEHDVRSALLQLATDQRLTPDLAYAVGKGIAHLPHGILDVSYVASLTRDARWGYRDERHRMRAQREGRSVAWARLDDATTASAVRRALDEDLSLEERVVAARSLQDSSPNLERTVVLALTKLAQDGTVAAELAAAAGYSFARLRDRQGIVDNELVGEFTSDAFEAFESAYLK